MKIHFWLIAATVLCAAVAARADERILSYDIDIAVRADASLDVTERITVRAERQQIRRGIYRDFPTRYLDRYGNRVVVGLEVLDVQRNGRREPWFTEQLGNGVRINTGSEDFLPAPAEHVYTLRYRTTRQLGFFRDHDELYWNAIGTGWRFPIDEGRVAVQLPAAVPVSQMRAEAYTGPQGARRRNYQADLPERGRATWQLTRALRPGEGMTIVLSFPKEVIAEPGIAQHIGWVLQDNRGVLVATFGLILFVLYCWREWWRVGRDPNPGVIIARYEPPRGHTPAGVRYMRDMSYDTRCFSADVLALAVAGALRITHDKGTLEQQWRLERSTRTSDTPLPSSQQALLERLFSSSQVLVLKQTNAMTLSAASSAHAKSLARLLQPRYFSLHLPSVAKAALLAAASSISAFLLAGAAGSFVIAALAGLMGVMLFVFAYLVRAPTAAGRQLLDEIAGFKLYLSVAERDELARVGGPGTHPDLDAKRYEQLLPYAVALDVEDAWTAKFTAAVGAAAAAEATNNIGWYHGGRVSDLASLSRAVGSGFTSQIASSSHAPGSSSGAGGGGSSGGGGGGGGGGGR